MKIKGRYIIQIIREGEVIERLLIPNGITNVGLDDLLDVMFRNQSQSSSWYVGLVDASGFSAFNDADTMSSHGGWTEFDDYDEANRQQWSPSNIGTGLIKNASYATYTINTGGTLKGFFIVDENTKNGTTGTLWSTAAFSNGNKTVISGDIIKVQYQITASG